MIVFNINCLRDASGPSECANARDGPNQSQGDEPMTKANCNISIPSAGHNSNPALARVGAELHKAIRLYTPLRIKAKRTHRTIKKKLRRIGDVAYALQNSGVRGAELTKAFRLRNDRFARLYKRSGYQAALDAARKPERDVIRLARHAMRLQPRSLADLAVHAVAARVEDNFNGGIPADTPELHTLIASIAKVAGVRFPKLPND